MRAGRCIILESEDGASVSELLEIDQERLPVVLILEDDDSVYKEWDGQDLPDVTMVSYEVGELTGSSES